MRIRNNCGRLIDVDFDKMTAMVKDGIVEELIFIDGRLHARAYGTPETYQTDRPFHDAYIDYLAERELLKEDT